MSHRDRKNILFNYSSDECIYQYKKEIYSRLFLRDAVVIT